MTARARITGVALITRKLHRYRDRKRFEAFLADRQRLKDRQGQERLVMRRSQRLEAADVTRNLRALDQVDQRERRSLETAQLKERRTDERRRHDHRMPPVRARSRDEGRTRRVTSTYSSTFARELAERAQARERAARLREDFAKAAANEEQERTGGEASKAPSRAETDQARSPKRRVVTDVNLQGDFEHAATDRGRVGDSAETDKAPRSRRTLRDYRAAKHPVITDVNLEGDFEHAATHMGNYTGEDAASSEGPNPSASSNQKPPRPRRPRGRKRDKDFDREM